MSIYLCREKLVATWKWFDTWLESLPNESKERETLYELVNRFFEHINTQEQMISDSNCDLTRLRDSFHPLKQEIKKFKLHMKVKKCIESKSGSHLAVLKNTCDMLADTPKTASLSSVWSTTEKTKGVLVNSSNM